MYYWLGSKKPSLVKNNINQVAYLVASIKAIYLALIKNSIIMAYFFKYQLTKLLFSITM